MRLVEHRSVRSFLDRARAWLEEEEAERALVLGICADLASRPVPGAPPYFATVEDDGVVATATLRTPPYNLVVSRAPLDALQLIARHLHGRAEPLPGVEGPVVEAAAFARLWSERAGVETRAGISQRIYACERVERGGAVEGALCAVEASMFPLLVEWSRGFYHDTGALDAVPAPDELLAKVRDLAGGDRLFVWYDGRPCAMACWTGPTAHGVRVSFVYTPPELRRRGYGTAVVAALTARMLDAGRRFCCLYTDLANPTSNALYQRIGYRPVCDWTRHVFG